MNRLLASALFAALASVAAAQTINFEELGAQPSAFSSANPLGNEYGPAVLFSGPSALNGGAILNQSGNFGVNIILPIVEIPLNIPTAGSVRDFIAGIPDFPVILTDACLAWAWYSQSATAPMLWGTCQFMEK